MPSRPTILIVEDDQLAQEGLCAVLDREGFTPVVTASGRGAGAYLSQNRPDLILLDMMMPEMDGWMFLGHFRHVPEWSHIPIVIMTGMEHTTGDWAASLGACDLLRKPIEVTTLLATIRKRLPSGTP